MSKKYKGLADEILKKVGGAENVSNLTHCMTRLRFVLNDNSKADKQGLKEISGVASVIESGGQLQVVIGAHVQEVYEELSLVEITNNDTNKRESNEKRKVSAKIIDFISGTFNPLIPAIAGAGMMKALLALLLLFKLVSKESQSYVVISFMADAAFYFLPILIAYSAANKLKCNPVLAMVLGGILLHPSFAGLKTAGNPVDVFGIPIRMVSYGSSVVPIILIVILQSYVERNSRKFIPDSVKVMFVPLVTVFVTGLIGITLLGPIGSFVGDFMAKGFAILGAHGSWLIILLVATFLPLLVMFGLHHSIVPLSIAQITTTGVENILGPGAIIANITQGTAALVVGLISKDNTTKELGISSGITGLMGITEPALYGITLPKKYPLIAAMIGGACGGLYAGLMNVCRYATGASGLPAIPLYIGENIWNLYNICIALVIAAAVTALLTYFLSFKFEPSLKKK